MTEVLRQIGWFGVEAILGIARLLTETWMPGLVAVGLLFLAILFILVVLVRGRAERRAVEDLRAQIQKAADEHDFRTLFGNIDATLKHEWAGGPKPRKRLATVWREYSETLIKTEDEGKPIRNAIRPRAFFNVGSSADEC